jgi:hypothetical protein
VARRSVTLRQATAYLRHTTDTDDERARRSRVLLVDESGADGRALLLHKGRTDARANRTPADAWSSTTTGL